ncbi:MAG: hypothetical protein V9F01_03865 [Chitinophagaceae bacterium]
MMYSSLYQYLILHKELPVPGIGTFLLERKSAEVDFPNRKVNPPSYAVALQAGSYIPGKNFFSWLAHALGISDREAIFRFNDFAFDIKKQISEGAVINWNAVGVLNKGLAGEIRFTPSATSIVFEEPVTAEKVIREKSEHMVRVGEDEKTSAEMTEMLTQEEETKSYWWAYALAVALLAIIFIGWYLSENGVDISSTANRSKLVPLEGSSTYQVLP